MIKMLSNITKKFKFKNSSIYLYNDELGNILIELEQSRINIMGIFDEVMPSDSKDFF